MVRLSNKNEETKSILSQNAINIFASPTAFLGGSSVQKEDRDVSPTKAKESTEHEGGMMRKAREDKFKKYYYRLCDKELYVYKSKKDTEHKTMINLVGVFIKIEKEEPLDKKNTLFPFSLILPNKERTFYLLSEVDRDNWMVKIK